MGGGRLLSWLGAVGGILAALAPVGGLAAEPGETPAVEPVAIAKNEAELPRLLKLRHNAFLEESRAYEGLYFGGRVALDEVLASKQRLVRAGVEMSVTPAEKVKYCQVGAGMAGTVERIVRSKWEAGIESSDAMYRATATRAAAEIDLHRAQAAAGQAQPEGEAALQKLLRERYEAATSEWEATSNLYPGGRIPLTAVLLALERRVAAGAELSPAEKEKHLRTGLESAAAIEAIVKEKHESDVEPAIALYEARQRRMTYEIDLLRLAAKREAAQAAELERLLKARYQAAADVASERLALYHVGRIAQHDVAAAIERQARAGVEMSGLPAEQVKHWEAAVTAAKEVESIVRGKFESNVEPVQAMQGAIGQRLTAEIELLRARQKAASGKLKER